jgi:hypothetical protein
MGADEYYNGVFLVTAPSKNTSWLNDGAEKTIAWTCTNIPGNVRLSLWLESPAAQGVEVAEIAASVPCAAQSQGWTIPAALPDDVDYAVVMQSLEMPALVEWNYLAIQHLHLTSPNAGALVQGGKYPLTWESSGLAGAAVRIELYAGGRRVRAIAAAAPNTGRYLWTVPYAQAPGPGFQVRVSTTAPLAAEDFSDETLRVLPAVTLTAPNGGQTWKRGRTYRIAWTYKNNPGTAVRLELYEAGVFNRTIALSAPIGAGGKGSYLWRIPAAQAPAATYTVRLRSAKYPNCFDFGNRPFTIAK